MSDQDFNLRFARMLRGMAVRLESGEWSLDNSWHDISSDPRATEAVSFTIKPRAEPPVAQPSTLCNICKTPGCDGYGH